MAHARMHEAMVTVFFLSLSLEESHPIHSIVCLPCDVINLTIGIILIGANVLKMMEQGRTVVLISIQILKVGSHILIYGETSK